MDIKLEDMTLEQYLTWKADGVEKVDCFLLKLWLGYHGSLLQNG